MTHIPLFVSFALSNLGKDGAYLDPGSGSFIIQLVIASLVGVGFLVRSYWMKITSLFRGTPDELQDEGDDGSYDI